MTRRALWPTLAWGTMLTTAMFSGCSYSRTTLPFPLAQAVRKSADTRFAAAQVAEREGHLQQAEEAYRELVAEQPDGGQYQHRLGVVLVRQGRLEDGIAALQSANTLDPRNSILLNDLGYACLLHGDFSEAVAATRQSLALNPNDQRAHNNLVLALGLSGESQEALALLRQGTVEVSARTALADARNSPSDPAQKAATGQAKVTTPPTPGSGSQPADEPWAPWDAEDLQLVSGREFSDFHDLLADEPPQEAGLVELLQELEAAPPADERAAVKYFEWQPLLPRENPPPTDR